MLKWWAGLWSGLALGAALSTSEPAPWWTVLWCASFAVFFAWLDRYVSGSEYSRN